MSTTSPPPDSSPSAVPPTSTTNTPPPQSQSPPSAVPPTSTNNTQPPQSQSPPSAVPPTSTNNTPPPQSQSPPPAVPPTSTNNTPPPQPQSPPPSISSPPPAVPAAPPPATVSSPPPMASSPPPATVTSPPPPGQAVSPSPPPPSNDPPPPPTNSTSPPPPQTSPSPPPPTANPPTTSSPPPPSSTPPNASPSPPPPTAKPPANSPPPPSSEPPTNSPPPPSSEPPQNSPPPPASKPPQNSPPPPASKPPQSSPPPPASEPPQNSPPPPASKPPQSSPPPPASKPPQSSPPPPASDPPINSPPPPRLTPPSNSTPNSSPPPPSIKLSPPPPSAILPPTSSSSPPSPTQTSVPHNEPVNPSSQGKNGVSTGGVVAISAGVGLLVLSLIGLMVWCIMKRKRKASGLNGGYIMPSPFGSSPNSASSFTKAHSSAPLIGTHSGSDSVSSPSEPGGLGNSRPWFTYEEMVVATNGFSAQNFLGEGGFGPVYKGCLPDGREIAVKQLKIGGGQGEREFKAEVETISRIHHRHLVSLVGYCIAENRRLLIYEYVANDTLYFHLHGQGQPVMDWARRVKVAAGAARGIAYLHEDCQPRIIHRDIKSSNILLDSNFEARVSDFGLAKLAIDADTHITTRVMGTFGYMAPEYASSGKLTDKSDVYSFGVVLLELITGRKPVDSSQPLGDESLVEWARPLLSDALESEQFDSLADPRLENNYVESEMFRMIEAAAACVRHSAAKRPRMGQVARALDIVAASDLTNGMRPGESEVFDSAQQSAEIRLFRRMAFGSQNYSTDFFSQNSLNGKENTKKEGDI